MVRVLVVGVMAIVLATACNGAPAGISPAGGSLRVVAGENFWGSVAAQLGGSRASVQSVVSDPNADPHEYESNPNDARAFADANLVVLNGAGYDDWGQKLLAANKSANRRLVNVARLLGRKQGDNPHFWYDPGYVAAVADGITAAFRSLDGAHAAYFDQRRAAFAAALKPYSDRIAEIRQKFGGRAVGSTESLFVYMAAALGLNLISPAGFMAAVAEGNDPPADTVVAFQEQIARKQVKALIYNVQTATAVTTNIKRLASAGDIPLVGMSETLQPESASFQEWQLAQLIALQNALNADAAHR